MVWCGKVRMIQQAHHVVWCAKPCGMYGTVFMWHGGMVCVIQQADGKRLISIVSTTTCLAMQCNCNCSASMCCTFQVFCNCSEHCTKQSSVDQVHILDQELTSPTSEQLYNVDSTVQCWCLFGVIQFRCFELWPMQWLRYSCQENLQRQRRWLKISPHTYQNYTETVKSH